MEKETKHYVEYLNHDPNWLKTITIDIDKFLIYREYINFFLQMYMKLSKDDGSTLSSRTLIISRLPRFEKLALSKSQLYIENKTMNSVLCAIITKRLLLFDMLKSKERFLYFTHVKDPYFFAEVE